MARNSLVLIIRWFLVVCSFFVICLQLVHAEQYALLVGVWDYENPNLQLEAPPNDLKVDGSGPLRARRHTGTDAYPDQSE